MTAFAPLVLLGTLLAAPPRHAAGTAAPQSSALGGASLDLGSDQHLRVEKDGAIWLDAQILVSGHLGLEPYANVLAHRLTRDRVTVAVGVQIPHMREPDSVVLAEIDLLEDRLLWSAVVSPPTLSHDRGSSWQVIFGDRITLVQREHVLVAVDMRTGTQAWSFASADPTFEDDYGGALAIERGEIEIAATRVRGRDVALEGKRRGSDTPLHVTLDLTTGRRVDARPQREPLPLFAFTQRPAPVVHDGPAPPPPPAPPGYDGWIVGATTLVWNTATGRGIIVNPTADALAQLVALARRQTFTAEDGTTQPVQWLMAIDTGVLATEMVVGKVAQPRKPPRPPTIWFEYDDGLDESGELVDADAIAGALDIPALRSRVDLRDLPAELRVRQREFGSIDVVFGPLGFHDDTQRWPVNHVRRM